MRMFTRLAIVFGLLLSVGACMQREEPAPVLLTPSYDKMGNPICPAGTVYATVAATGAQGCVDQSSL